MSKKCRKLVVLVLLISALVMVSYANFKPWTNEHVLDHQGGMPANSSYQPVLIEVNASYVLGEMPDIFSASIWIQKTYFTKTKNAYGGLSPYILDKFLNETRLRWIQTGNAYAIASSKNFSDFREKLENTILHNPYWIRIRDYANKNNITVIFTFHQALMPNWLSSRAGEEWPIYQYAPPKCYKDKCTSWDEITCYTDECKRITEKQFREKGYVEGWESVAKEYAKVLLGIRSLGIAVGHEPNADWIGTEESFYKLYEYTVRGVKQVDKSIEVGGIGSWGWDSPKVKCTEYCDANWRVGNIPYPQVKRVCELCTNEGGWANPNNKSMTENFIEYCASHNIPLDFINYHAFHTRPEAFIKQASVIREWLKENGFNNTKIYPADWTIWGGSYPLADYIDDEQNPAYVIRALYFMDKARIDWHGHDFDVNDGGNKEKKGLNERGNDTQFIGDWAIFTRDGIIKPVWNAFEALSKLPDQRIQATSSDEDHVIAIAGKDNQKISVLISNYIRAVAINEIFKDCMLSKGYTTDEFKSIKNSLKQTAISNPPQSDPDRDGSTKLDENYVKWVIENTDLDLSGDKDIKKDLKSCIPEVMRKIEGEKYLQKHPREITLSIINLEPGTYILTIYTIDQNHSNSCRYNKKTEPTSTDTECGINGIIDQRVRNAREEAKSLAGKIAKEYLHSKCYSEKDVEYLLKAWEECSGKDRCFKDFVEQYYQRLERCNGIFGINCSTCDFETIWSELQQAFELYENAYFNLFYYGNYTINGHTIAISDSVDKINNDPNVSLDGSRQERIICIGKSGEFALNLTMQPYSVILVELRRI